MATSKNNRKKGRKRQQMHKRPIPDHVIQAQKEQEAEEVKSLQRLGIISFIGIVLMIGGFVMVAMGYEKAGFPVTFCGSFIGLVTVSPELKHRKIVIAGHIIYCVMVTIMWISAMTP